jgi:hypothetical protein
MMMAMLVVLLPALIALVGLVVFVLANGDKPKEIGRAMLWCGLLVVTFALSRVSVRLP